MVPASRFANGKSHCDFGRQSRLRISQGDLGSVKLVDRFFEITTPDKRSSAAAEKLLESWYRQHAQLFFETRLQHCLTSPGFRGLSPPSWSIRLMKRRWGSCTKEGRILLNLQLIQTSPSCIDYVITHELCHLIEHNHTAAFYHLLDRAMPDWRKRKKKLEMHEK
jgi:predicted metal-dependent hydrolase